MTLALSEPYTTAVFLTVFGLLVTASVLLTRVSNRVGIPVVLIFLVLGMIGGSEGLGGIDFDNYELAFQMGTVALVLILFDGGLNTSLGAIRTSAFSAGILATLGVAGTAVVLALIGRLLGLGWEQALLVGAIVSSTDAAAVFAVLRGGSLHVKQRVRNTLEVESCINDPMAVILTVVMVDVIQTGALGAAPDPLAPPPPFGFWRLFYEVPLQLLIGAIVGLGVGLLTRWVLSHARVATAGLYPVITLASAFLAYGVATLASGSGFLAVFAAAALLGHGPLPFRSGLTRVHDSVAWFCQVAMFLMLGLLVFPRQLLPVAGVGLALGLGLAFLARPLVVTLCLLPFRWPLKEVGYVSWVGIRGAVPIILATFPVMAQVPDAEKIFHIVFFIVVVSALVPGASIVPLTRRLGLADPCTPAPAAALELHSLRQMNGEINVYHIEPCVAVCGVPLSQIPFPEGAAAIMVVRGDEIMAARGYTVFEVGDHVYVFCRPEDEPQIGLLFGKTAVL